MMFKCVNFIINQLQSQSAVLPLCRSALLDPSAHSHLHIGAHVWREENSKTNKTQKALCDSHHSRRWFSYIWNATPCDVLFRCAQYFNRNNMDLVGVREMRVCAIWTQILWLQSLRWLFLGFMNRQPIAWVCVCARESRRWRGGVRVVARAIHERIWYASIRHRVPVQSENGMNIILY